MAFVYLTAPQSKTVSQHLNEVAKLEDIYSQDVSNFGFLMDALRSYGDVLIRSHCEYKVEDPKDGCSVLNKYSGYIKLPNKNKWLHCHTVVFEYSYPYDADSVEFEDATFFLQKPETMSKTMTLDRFNKEYQTVDLSDLTLGALSLSDAAIYTQVVLALANKYSAE